MTDKCPLCGATMQETRWPPEQRLMWDGMRTCESCDYWEELHDQADGTIVAVGHEPEGVEG